MPTLPWRRLPLCLPRYLWAAPCSVLGLAFALPLMALGARIRAVQGTLEIAWPDAGAARSRTLQRLPFCAITLGHVIVGTSPSVLARVRAHEQVHVRQYERWGPLFLLAYPLSSAVQLLRGRDPYWFNRFEIDARRRSAPGAAAGPDRA